jgi:monoamine oxidase
MAIKNIHLISSGKVFVRTKTAFWKDQPPESTLTCTITDEATRATYLFDFDDTKSGVICLSYTWEDSAVKFNALIHEERVQLCLRILEKIYGKDLISQHVVESVSFSWEGMKGYNGGFKLTYPGQYEYQLALFKQPFEPGPELHNGVFLAGETTSWAGGWLEGALQSGLNASRAIVSRLGGCLNLPPSDL